MNNRLSIQAPLQDEQRLWKELYGSYLHHDLCLLIKNHVKSMPKGWRLKSFVRVCYVLDDYLTDTLCTRFGYPLTYLQVDPKQLERIIQVSDKDLEEIVLDLTNCRFPCLTQNTEDLMEFVNALLFNQQTSKWVLPCMETVTNTREELIRQIALHDAHKLLALLLARQFTIPAIDDEQSLVSGTTSDSDTSSEDDEETDMRRMFMPTESNPSMRNDEFTDLYGFNRNIRLVPPGSTDGFVFSLIRSLEGRGVDVSSIMISTKGSGSDFIPIPHVFLEYNNLFALMHVLRDFPSLRMATDAQGQTILHKIFACSPNIDWVYVKNIVSLSLDQVNLDDRYGDTPLHILARSMFDKRQVGSILSSMNYAVAYNTLSKSNQMGYLPIAIAMSRSDIEATPIVESFLSMMKNVSNSYGSVLGASCQVLHQTIRSDGRFRHIQLFFEFVPQATRYWNQRFPSQGNRTLLELVLEYQRVEVFYYLISKDPSALFNPPEDHYDILFAKNDLALAGFVLDAFKNPLFPSIMKETQRSLVTTQTKLFILDKVLGFIHHHQNQYQGWDICFCLQACLTSLIESNDFETLHAFFHHAVIPQKYGRELQICLADYRDSQTRDTFFHLIGRRVICKKNGKTYVKSETGFEVLQLICLYGANPYSYSDTCRGISLLPYAAHDEFVRFSTNVTLEELINEYDHMNDQDQPNDDTPSARNKTNHTTTIVKRNDSQSIYESFRDCIHLGLMKHPTYCADDGHTYDLLSLQRWLQKSQTSPLTRARLQKHPHLRPDWITIQKMRDHFEYLRSNAQKSIHTIGTRTKAKRMATKKRRIDSR